MNKILNCLKQVQELDKIGQEAQEIRTTTRIFSENEMIVNFEANGVKATRTFKRVK